jgi:NAD(P) transhydrogenase subunit beta
LGLKGLSSPETAVRGNRIAIFGMAVGLAATFILRGPQNLGLILVGVAAGAVIGAVAGTRVPMTAMPQMVGLLNGVGGGAAALVSTVEYLKLNHAHEVTAAGTLLSILFGTLIGGISFAGSMIAFGKLQGFVAERPVTYPGQQLLNFLLLAVILALAAGLFFVVPGAGAGVFTGVLLGALLLGVTMVLPIGGADMPVVISLLNAFTGLAAASTGFVLSNNALVISGTLVGASGTILTLLMCKAMNRSLTNVLFGAFGAVVVTPAGAKRAAAKPIHEIGVEDAVILLSNARRVIVVPGYGMAVAQAQHAVREMADLLEQRGVEVKYAIHPVAGRMPGHMNVLLAEANVPYPQLFDLEEINPEFETTDVALVIGANDVVNPAARHDAQSPIYGMPILDVDKAHNVIIIKRSLNPGFAGIDNELYYAPNTFMLFGDARAMLTKLTRDLKEAA